MRDLAVAPVCFSRVVWQSRTLRVRLPPRLCHMRLVYRYRFYVAPSGSLYGYRALLALCPASHAMRSVHVILVDFIGFFGRPLLLPTVLAEQSSTALPPP
jgi:hypothetical protein